MCWLVDSIVHELELERPTFLLECDEDGDISESGDLDTQSYFIEFDVQGRITNYQEVMSVYSNDPTLQVSPEPDYEISRVKVFDDNGVIIKPDNANFENEIKPHILNCIIENF